MKKPCLKLLSLILSFLCILYSVTAQASDLLRVTNTQNSPVESQLRDSLNGNGSDEKLSVWQIAQPQIEHIAELMGLHPIIKELIETPQIPPVLVDLGIYLDNGNPFSAEGVRIAFSILLGPSKGGIRAAKAGKIEDAKGLSFFMALKCSIAGIPLGGGKGEIIVDLSLLNQNEWARLAKEYVWQIQEKSGGLFSHLKDIPAPDAGTDSNVMGYMMDALLAWRLLHGGLEYKESQEALLADPAVQKALEFYKDDNIRNRKKPQDILDTQTIIYDRANELRKQGYKFPEFATFTDKPVDKGGSEVREEATGLGLYYAMVKTIQEYAKRGQRPFVGHDGVKGFRFIVAGYGNVGSHAARHVWQNRGIIQAISNAISAIYSDSKRGIDIGRLDRWILREKKRFYEEALRNELARNPGLSDEEKSNIKKRIWRQDVDLRRFPGVKALDNPDEVFFLKGWNVMLPCAMHCHITRAIAEKIEAAPEGEIRIIGEGGNAPVTHLADIILERRRIHRQPDIVANQGGVVDSMYEAKRNLTSQDWPVELEKSRLQERISNSVEITMELAREHSITNRDAAWVIAMKRLVDAMLADLRVNNPTLAAKIDRPYDPWVEEIYTSPQTSTMVIDIVRSGRLREAIRKEEAVRTKRVVRLLNKMFDYFESKGVPTGSRKALFLGGPITYKDKWAYIIKGQLSLRHGIHQQNILYLELEKYRLTSHDIHDILSGTRVLVEKSDGATEWIQLTEGGILMLEDNNAISDEILSPLPKETRDRIFAVAADVMPCMSIHAAKGIIVLTNDDYTQLRSMLSSWFLQNRDPYESLWLSRRHIREALKKIYPSFKNKQIIFNTFDPFELSFMKRQALQLLGLALREARQRLDRASSEAERKDIKEIIDIAKRFIYILRQVPYIDADAVGLSEEAPYKQMLSINSGSTHTSLNSTKLTFISLIDSSA